MYVTNNLRKKASDENQLLERMGHLHLRVSIKGVVEKDGKILLLKNERNEWELPGGGIELNETPEECVIREIQEELNITCEVKKIIDSWVYEVLPGKHVFIVTYLCEPRISDIAEVKMSDEHSDLQWTPLSEIENVYMPAGYKQSIKQVFSL